MEPHRRPHHHSEWNHRSTTTTTTIAGLSWPPLRNASFLKAGYSGLEASLCLEFPFGQGRSAHHVRPQPQQQPITLATIHRRLSAALPPVPPFSRRKETGSARSGEQRASRTSGATMLAAVCPVSLCTGIRQEDFVPSAIAGVPDVRALIQGSADGSAAVSARFEVVGGDAVYRSSKCSRVLTAGSGTDSSKTQRSGDASRRCEECIKYLESVLLPRVRETAAAAAAAAAATGGYSGNGDSEKRGAVQESVAGTKRRVNGAGDSSPADGGTAQQQTKLGLDVGRREVSPQAATGTKRGEACAEDGRRATEGVSSGKKTDATVTVWRADDGSARKRLKKRACSDPAPKRSSSRRRHSPAGDDKDLQPSRGLSTLSTIPRHRWALNNSKRRESLAC